MPAAAKLPPDYNWQEKDGRHVFCLGDKPLVRVCRKGFGGWVVQPVVEAIGIDRQELAVRSLAAGRAAAVRWVSQRQRVVARVCGREDLAPPVVHGPPRRWYAWQYASWTKAS